MPTSARERLRFRIGFVVVEPGAAGHDKSCPYAIFQNVETLVALISHLR
jgi:hypothetical protein